MEGKGQMSAIKEALLAAHGQIVTDGRKRWRIEARDWKGHFSCVAQDLNPRNEDEELYCILDLWRSESDRRADPGEGR
jgi:adenine specific DNA methylase Mod